MATTTMQFLAAVPKLNGGDGQAPPGSGGVLTIMHWGLWLVAGACVIGFLICAAKLALEHRGGGGRGGEHVGGIGAVMAACVLAGSASGIVGALLQ